MPSLLKQGPIPAELSKLKELETLDLSDNQLSGELVRSGGLTLSRQVNRLHVEKLVVFILKVVPMKPLSHHAPDWCSSSLVSVALGLDKIVDGESFGSTGDSFGKRGCWRKNLNSRHISTVFQAILSTRPDDAITMTHAAAKALAVRTLRCTLKYLNRPDSQNPLNN